MRAEYMLGPTESIFLFPEMIIVLKQLHIKMYLLRNIFLYVCISCIPQRGLPLGREHRGSI